jgi:hypothetical protein
MTDHTSPATGPGGGRQRTARRLACALGALVACAGLAACGSSGSPTSAASATQDAFKFSRCMREHGLTNFPDPETGANGTVRLQFRTGAKLNPHTFEVAQNACRKYRPMDRVKLSPAERVAREEQVRRFAKCMREHGVDIPAPTTSGGGVRIQLGQPGGGGPNPESPAFQAAQKACQGLLPKRPGGGPGGGAQTNSSKGSGAGGGTGFSLGAGG